MRSNFFGKNYSGSSTVSYISEITAASGKSKHLVHISQKGKLNGNKSQSKKGWKIVCKGNSLKERTERPSKNRVKPLQG